MTKRKEKERNLHKLKNAHGKGGEEKKVKPTKENERSQEMLEEFSGKGPCVTETSDLYIWIERQKNKEVHQNHCDKDQTCDGKEQVVDEGNEKANKPKGAIVSRKKKRQEERNHEGVNADDDQETDCDLYKIAHSKKKRKQKAETESYPHSESNKNADIEMLDVNQGEVTENAAVVKKKKKKSKEKKLKQQSEKESCPAIHPGLVYLHTWYTNRQHWRFKKVRQVWLLQNLFDQEQISDEDFSILLKYLEGLKGAAKDKTIQMAEQRIESQTGELDIVVDSRVRQVLQLLTE